ncbi:MAG: MGMT family protein, partial [Planctomycetes bacterium]|nr:MGMT family protein [Planctomycetota bacterium]
CGGFDRGQPQPVKLDLSGSSDFARRVYRAALRIRPGETISYGELASRIGRPGAARAVGRALAANPVAPVVPCHRIVAANGALTGYSGPGGLRAKARLLAREELDLRGLPREGAEGS